MEFIKFIKKNKSIVVAVLILIAIAVTIFIVKDTVMFDESQAEYGNRLEGLDKVQVTDEQIKQIKSNLKDNTKSVDVSTSGRTINIIIEVKKDTSVEDAKSYANKALETFTDEQKSYFDIEALIKNDEDKEHYPVIGYKHKTRESYTWTRDR